jgi:hypothetical protein
MLCTFCSNEKEITQTSVIGLLSYQIKCFVKKATCITWTKKLYLIVLCYICKQFEQAFDMKGRPKIIIIPIFCYILWTFLSINMRFDSFTVCVLWIWLIWTQIKFSWWIFIKPEYQIPWNSSDFWDKMCRWVLPPNHAFILCNLCT